jgi:outer membrane protein assembly factor BamB
VVYFGSVDGNVYALNAGTGALLWMHNTGWQLDSSPAVANGVVFIGGADTSSSTELTLYALNASTGALLWSNTIGPNNGAVAVANGVVYVGGCEGLCALNASTGAQLWSTNTTAASLSSPAVANGVVYNGSRICWISRPRPIHALSVC